MLAKEFTVLHDLLQLCQHVPLPVHMKGYAFDFIYCSGFHYQGLKPLIFFWNTYLDLLFLQFLSNWLHVWESSSHLAPEKLKMFSAGSLITILFGILDIPCCWLLQQQMQKCFDWNTGCNVMGTLWLETWILCEHLCQFLNVGDHCISS